MGSRIDKWMDGWMGHELYLRNAHCALPLGVQESGAEDVLLHLVEPALHSSGEVLQSRLLLPMQGGTNKSRQQGGKGGSTNVFFFS